jgi:hypothetical protein
MPPTVTFAPRVAVNVLPPLNSATSEGLAVLFQRRVYGPAAADPQRVNAVFQVPLPPWVVPFPDQNRVAAYAEGAVKWLSNATEKAAVMEAWERNGVDLRGFMGLSVVCLGLLER